MSDIKNTIRLKRLEALRYMLLNHDKIFGKDTKKPVKFNMNVWCDPDKICGTAACALGSAGLYTPFRRAGLKSNGYEVLYVGWEGIDAGSKFFGITEEEALFLFMPEAYSGSVHSDCAVEVINFNEWAKIKPKKIKPADVAKRVEYLIHCYKQA